MDGTEGQVGVDVEDALRMGRELVREHGLSGWTVGLDRARTRAGACRYDRRRITVSGPITLLHGPEEVRATLLHEIAHALVGAGHGHDAVWRATAVRIGADGARTMPADAPTPVGEWVGTCPAGHVVHRHRRPTRVSSCRSCAAAFEARHVLSWTHRGRPVDLGPVYAAQLQAALSGTPTPPALRLGVGTPVRLLGSGRYAGLGGRVVARGRTRYRVQTSRGELSVPFTLVEPLT
ncbi:SprT-like domain-containing protein [Kineococcus gynurae]|uniref:SprT-like domain-containing protein n=1 Tax=Kineococcus gynurae TaxID=452979 RepID=A0ABV5LN11_9ACTN